MLSVASKMVVRPESPVNVASAQEDSDLFRDYMWMNDSEKFDEEYLEELFHQDLNRVVEELEREPTNGTSTEQARPSPVEATPEILTKSNLNPDAQEFVPSSPPSR